MKHGYKSRFKFTVGDVVYVNQRWFPPQVVDACSTPDIVRIILYLRIFDSLTFLYNFINTII